MFTGFWAWWMYGGATECNDKKNDDIYRNMAALMWTASRLKR